MTDAGEADLARALRDVAVEIAVAAGTTLAERAGAADLRVTTKSSATDPVTEVDRAIEAFVDESLRRTRPDDGLVGEEGADRTGTSGIRWLVDPIDGTVNFLYGIPGCNVSLAAARDGVVLAGAVVDPLHGDVFAAALGSGATRNGVPIACTEVTDPALALIATGFGYEPERRRRQAEVLARVLPQVRDLRRVGAAAIDLCWVACGRVDGFFEHGLNPWDWAAGGLVAAEAGAVVTTLEGDVLDPRADVGVIVAAGPGLHEPLRRIAAEAGAADV